jgi:hypothetical protein
LSGKNKNCEWRISAYRSVAWCVLSTCLLDCLPTCLIVVKRQTFLSLSHVLVLQYVQMYISMCSHREQTYSHINPFIFLPCIFVYTRKCTFILILQRKKIHTKNVVGRLHTFTGRTCGINAVTKFQMWARYTIVRCPLSVVC